MKYLTLLPAMILPAFPASADGHMSDLFADHNPSEVVTLLEQQNGQSPSDHFALGAAHFLSAIENAYQLRYQYNFGNLAAETGMDLPFLSLPIAENPSAEPFDPAALNTLFETAIQDLARANESLDQINDIDFVSLTVDLTGLWLDINSNGVKDDGEEFYNVLSAGLGFSSTDIAPPKIITTFDTADAAWLSAYSHMLSGMSELALSADPTNAVSTALAEVAHVDALRGDAPFRSLWGMSEIASSQDMDILVATVLAAFGDLDANHTQNAKAHFLNGIEDNKVFWQRLESETDNTNEFIPNDTQTSTMPIEFPQGIGATWQTVLSDVEAVLKGERLLPHWRLGEKAGVNLAAILDDPSALDLLRLFLGHSVTPYVERGPVIDFTSLENFDDMTQGNSPLFAMILN